MSHLRFSSNEVASHVKQLPFRPLLLLLLFRHKLDFSGKHSSHAEITLEDYSLTLSSLSIAMYSFIQPNELRRRS